MTKEFGTMFLNSCSLPVDLFGCASYSNEATKEGHLLVDLMELSLKPYLATLGNLDQLNGEDEMRRKNNFLKLKEFHAFTSPQDGILEPYQSGVFGHYAEVTDSEELLAKFKSLGMVDMKDSGEYMNDTYGLRTLDERGGLFHHVMDKVPHMCWIIDFDGCSVDQALETYLRPILN
ncbi:hypothetical protein Poli38472_008580 [Pythium oligandrum]|uniref:Uncharacterized protein n=1 Tax=Pythium oligandrum TaxID=41045 RepID=A0A8K1C4E9_PYTOL|nr:hypothetical protein Poli38472_008580 [Pythium oligandrum]|eukprot:TMW55932.1 hypothetical protein Poli38472_008580 [Pythium oligandrum]